MESTDPNLAQAGQAVARPLRTEARGTSARPLSALSTEARRTHARPLSIGLVALCASLLCLLLTACGGTGKSGASGAAASGAKAHVAGAQAAALSPLPKPLAKETSVSLVLDFIPNAVHSGIYRAIAEGLYRREHIDLHVIVPSETQDPLTMVDAGKVDFGLCDGSEILDLIDKGGDVKAVMAIGQRPFGGLIARASEHLTSPKQLQGKKVGVTGVASDYAVLDTEVRAAGGDPSKVDVVDVGEDGAEALRTGKIAAFTGFWPDDGVQLQVTGEPVTSFKLDDWGGPAYPGLVAFTRDSTIAGDPRLVRDFVGATVLGYEETLRDPSRSLQDLLKLNPEVEAKVAKASLEAYLPLYDEEGKVRFGTIQSNHIASLSQWMVSHELIDSPVPFSRYGTNAFLPPS